MFRCCCSKCMGWKFQWRQQIERCWTLLTCIPPTMLFNPSLSKGPTAGFAPIPIITCKMKRKEKDIYYMLLKLSFGWGEEEGARSLHHVSILETSCFVFKCRCMNITPKKCERNLKHKNHWRCSWKLAVSASIVDPFSSLTAATCPSELASKFLIEAPWSTTWENQHSCGKVMIRS